MTGLRPKESSTAILEGMAELDAALRDRSGLQVTEEDLQVIRAGASISLARRQIHAGEYDQAAASLSDARGRYHELLKRQLNSALLVKVAAGLLRAGAPGESLAALAALAADDPPRKYMAAEALFSMGDRSGAAEQYSEWLALKCASNAFMLTSDEYGEEHWTYLQRTGARKTDRCQALPAELRARLEALKLETGYLKLLPKTNDAPVLFHAQADQ